MRIQFKRTFSWLLSITCAIGFTAPAAALKPTTAAAAADDAVLKELAQLCADADYLDSVIFQIGSSKMVVNGQTKPIDPQQGDITQPKVVAGNRTMLPARALVETLGGEIHYTGNDVVSIAASDETDITLEIGSKRMEVNGQTVQLDTTPFAENGRTFIPIRAVSESMGCNVDYQTDGTITITQPCQTCRLVALTDKTLPDTNPERVLQLGDDAYALIYPTIDETSRALEKLERAGISAWPDAPVQVQEQNVFGSTKISLDSQTLRQLDNSKAWHDESCGLTDFKNTASGSRPVTVAVIDSGIDPALTQKYAGRISQNGYDIFTGKTNIIPEDKTGHGTLVSSLIAQYTPSNVRILPIRIFGEYSTSPLHVYSSQWLTIFQHIQKEGASIVNMSLTCQKLTNTETPMDTLVQRQLINKGISVVCAAGNRGVNTEEYCPANLQGAVVVASSDKNSKPSSGAKFKSNFGSSVDLAAPGEDITGIGLSGRTVTESGTSFAAPLVTAAGAVLMSKQSYTPSSLEKKLTGYTKAFASDIKDYGAGVLYLKEDNPNPDSVVTAYRFSTSKLNLKEKETGTISVAAVYQDNTTKDVTSTCGLKSSDSKVISVSTDGKVTALQAGTAEISVTNVPSGITKPSPVKVTVTESPTADAKRISGYQYSVTKLDIKQYENVKLEVYAVYSDGTRKDVTNDCGLYSKNPEIALVQRDGTVTGIKAGKTTISIGSLPSGLSIPAPVPVTVTDKPDDSDLPDYTDTPGDDKPAKITGYQYNVDVLNLTEGETAQIEVTAIYSDGSKKDVTRDSGLYSTASNVASVSKDGTVTAQKAGTTRISMGTLPSGLTIPKPINVTVKADTGTDNPNPDKPIVGGVLTLTEDGLTKATLLDLSTGTETSLFAMFTPENFLAPYTTWKSSNPSVAQVNLVTTVQAEPGSSFWTADATHSAKVMVKAVQPGDCVITATCDGQSVSCNVRVTDYSKSLFSLDTISAPTKIQNGDSATFKLKVQTPLPYAQGSHPLVLYCALYARDSEEALNGWLEYQSVFHDGGSGEVVYTLDTGMHDIPNGTYQMVFALFYSDRFYTNAAIVQDFLTVTLT